MKKQLLLLLTVIIMNVNYSSAQTNVSGGIYADVTWTKANSPYIVTGNIVVFPGKTLTIQPGVEVRFDGNYDLEMRGNLIAIGLVTDSISFVSNTQTTKNAWNCINILNTTHGGSGKFEYCIIKNAYRGISVECCWSPPGYIKKTHFDNNTNGSFGYAGLNLVIDSCLFTNNYRGVGDADKVVTNSVFINNNFGINCERFEARNCFFKNNLSAIEWPGSGSGIIDSCTIIENVVGVRVGMHTVTNNNISNNTIGLSTSHSSSTANGIQYYVPIKNNRICNNTLYNVENLNSQDKNITQNCFCTDDSTVIESKLFDGYDDITKGLFNYDIYDSTCLNKLQSVYKVGPNGIENSNLISKNISISPNPSNGFYRLEINTSEKIAVEITDVFGRLVQRIALSNPLLQLDLSNEKNGVYFVRVMDEKGSSVTKKIIKQ